MRFTTYGKQAAKAEPVPAITETGATAHMLAAGHDAGMTVLLTGADVYGRRIVREARSVYGAYFTMRAMWGIQRAWHVREDGTRKLLISRD